MSSCRRAKSIRAGSWFSGSHLSMEKILDITFLWCEDLEQKIIQKWVGIAEHTIVDWCHFCREVCAGWYNDHTGADKIGGVGTVVEIDESICLGNENTMLAGLRKASGSLEGSSVALTICSW